MKITKMFMTVSAAMILLAGTGLTSASADGGSYDTDGTVSFVVNPDDPSQPVVPDDNSGNVTGTVQDDGGSTSHSYVQPSHDLTVKADTTRDDAMLPETGVERTEDWPLTLFTVFGLVGLGFVSYHALKKMCIQWMTACDDHQLGLIASGFLERKGYDKEMFVVTGDGVQCIVCRPNTGERS